MTIGVVVGMLSEARLLEGLDFRIVAGGGHAAATQRKAEELAGGDVAALVSFGIAGALDPSLKPGDLIVAEAVNLADGTSIACDAVWRQRLLQKANERARVVAGRSVAAATSSEKAELFRGTGAVAVDM